MSKVIHAVHKSRSGTMEMTECGLDCETVRTAGIDGECPVTTGITCKRCLKALNATDWYNPEKKRMSETHWSTDLDTELTPDGQQRCQESWVVGEGLDQERVRCTRAAVKEVEIEKLPAGEFGGNMLWTCGVKNA